MRTDFDSFTWLPSIAAALNAQTQLQVDQIESFEYQAQENLLDQSKISGIGVAWGSEILFNADLSPDMKTCDQVLTEGNSGSNKLVDSMIEVRKKIQETYELELTRTLEVCKIYNNDNNLRLLINGWFENLYEIREMNIYKKGSKLQVLGRSWWV